MTSLQRLFGSTGLAGRCCSFGILSHWRPSPPSGMGMSCQGEDELHPLFRIGCAYSLLGWTTLLPIVHQPYIQSLASAASQHVQLVNASVIMYRNANSAVPAPISRVYCLHNTFMLTCIVMRHFLLVAGTRQPGPQPPASVPSSLPAFLRMSTPPTRMPGSIRGRCRPGGRRTARCGLNTGPRTS